MITTSFTSFPSVYTDTIDAYSVIDVDQFVRKYSNNVTPGVINMFDELLNDMTSENYSYMIRSISLAKLLMTYILKSDDLPTITTSLRLLSRMTNYDGSEKTTWYGWYGACYLIIGMQSASIFPDFCSKLDIIVSTYDNDMVHYAEDIQFAFSDSCINFKC